MKSGDVQRGIKPGTSRSVGDAPLIGKVSRMRGAGQEPGQGGGRRSHRGGDVRWERMARTRRQVMLMWSGLLVLLVLVLLAAFLVGWFRSLGDRSDASFAGISQDFLEEAKQKFPPPTEEEALAFVKKALSNRDPEKIPELFRMGKTTAAGVIDFLGKIESINGEIIGYQWMRSMDANGLSLEGVLVKFKNQERETNRLAMLTPDGDGIWKLDFASFARLCEPGFEVLLKGGEDEGTIRVYVGRDNYYNGPFRDDREWHCFGLASPDSELLLLGYAKAESAGARALEAILTEEQKAVRAILEIRRVEGAEARQFEIVRVLAEDWVESDRALEERY